MNSKKTSVISLRVPTAQKLKLEAQAAQKNQSLTDYVRDRLAASDGEKILREAQRDLSALELGAEKLRQQLAEDGRQYSRTVTDAETELRGLTDQLGACVREFDRAAERHNSERLTWWALYVLTTLLAGGFGGVAVWVLLGL